MSSFVFLYLGVDLLVATVVAVAWHRTAGCLSVRTGPRAEDCREWAPSVGALASGLVTVLFGILAGMTPRAEALLAILWTVGVGIPVAYIGLMISSHAVAIHHVWKTR